MSKHETHVPVEQFATDVRRFWGELRGGEVIVLEDAGREFVVKVRRPPRADRRRRDWKPSEADLAAFRASAGGWKGLIDVDQFHEALAESRRLSTRPRPDL